MPRGDAAEEVASAPPAGDLMDCMPREDISKQLTSKLLADFKSSDWKVRKAVSETIIGILQSTKMRIECVGLNELMGCIKEGMKESNKAVLK